ncbi:MAG: hypothetical protein ACXVRX_09635 [Solirubrobacteraceae bacterium]
MASSGRDARRMRSTASFQSGPLRLTGGPLAMGVQSPDKLTCEALRLLQERA